MTDGAPTTTIRRMREARGLSLRELERITGINRGTLSRIERGWLASAEETAKLLAALSEERAVKPEDAP